ncbi:MAG: hypothetical protein FWF15_12250, partial [Oscillospiraceae bacterium]|nr:hypothetical protein [Oscillospiraceae bacterium]
MERKIKTAVLFAILTFIVSAAIYSCDGGAGKEENANPNNNNTEAPETFAEQQTADEDKSAIDELGEFDFGGHEFKIFNRVNDGWANSRLDREELTGDVYDDAVFNRNRNIEDRFNVQIKMVVYDDQGKVRPMLKTGMGEYDLYTGRNAEAFTFAQEGLINGINEFTYIDLTKQYWNQFLTEQFTIMGKKYFAVGAFNFSNLDMSYV